MGRTTRFVQWAAIGFALWPAASWAGEAEKPAQLSPEKVAQAIRHLGSVDWETRHAARELLRRVGPAALAALDKADPALHAQAAEVAEAIRYGFDERGIDDETPDKVRELAAMYRKLRLSKAAGEDREAFETLADPAKLSDILEKLAAEGTSGQTVARAIAAAETDEAILETAFTKVGERVEMPVGNPADLDGFKAHLTVTGAAIRPEHVGNLAAFDLLRGTLPRMLAKTVGLLDVCSKLGATAAGNRLADLAVAGRFDELEALLRVAAASNRPEHVRNLVAFHLLRGSLPRVLAETVEHLDVCSKLGAAPFAARTANWLCNLQRASGRPAEALETALRWDLKDLASHLAIEAGRWQDMPELKEDPKTLSNGIGKLGRVAACHRLLGHREAFEAMIGRIQAYGAKNPDGAWFAVKVLLLQGRIKEAIELLRASKNYNVLVEILELQGRFAQAREAAEAAKNTPGEGKAWAEPWLAGFETMRGHREESRAAFATLADRAIARAQLLDLAAVTDREFKLGFEQEAFDLLSAGPERWGFALREYALREFFPSQQVESAVRQFFPSPGDQAVAWWPILSREFPTTPRGKEAIARLRELLARKTPEATLDAWLRKADEAAAELEGDRRLESHRGPRRHLRALRPEPPRNRLLPFLLSILEKGLLPFAGCQALHRGESVGRRSARLRRGLGGWARRSQCALPPRMGTRQNGPRGRRARQDGTRSSAPHGRGELPRELGSGVGAFGLAMEAEAEWKVLLLTEAPDSWLYSQALLYEANRAEKAGDHDRAALLVERWLMAPNTDIVGIWISPYLTLPAYAAMERARARLGEGKTAESLAEALRALDLVPCDIGIPLVMVPDFEKAGRRQEADALFDQVFHALDAARKECPGWAPARNSLAWMAARCHRRLDAALDHARKAVQLMPNAATYIDALAEVHFARGEFDKAIEFGQKALALDLTPYYREQLERFRSGRDAKKAP